MIIKLTEAQNRAMYLKALERVAREADCLLNDGSELDEMGMVVGVAVLHKPERVLALDDALAALREIKR